MPFFYRSCALPAQPSGPEEDQAPGGVGELEKGQGWRGTRRHHVQGMGEAAAQPSPGTNHPTATDGARLCKYSPEVGKRTQAGPRQWLCGQNVARAAAPRAGCEGQHPEQASCCHIPSHPHPQQPQPCCRDPFAAGWDTAATSCPLPPAPLPHRAPPALELPPSPSPGMAPRGDQNPLPPHTINFPVGQRRGRARSRHAGGRPACPDPCPGRRRKPHCSPKCNFKKHRMPNPRRTIAAPAERAPPGSTEAPRGPHGQGLVSAPRLPVWGWEPPQLPLVPLGRAVSLFFFPPSPPFLLSQ